MAGPTPNCRESSDPCALYRIYDTAGELLYVGITLDLPSRMRTHSHRPWWSENATRIDVEWFPNFLAAETAEADAIYRERPIHNLKGNAQRWHEAVADGLIDVLRADVEAARPRGVLRALVDRFVANPSLLLLPNAQLAAALSVSPHTVGLGKRAARAELNIVPPAILRSPNYLKRWKPGTPLQRDHRPTTVEADSA